MNIHSIESSSVEQKNKRFLGIQINAENAVLFFCILFTLMIGLLPISYGFWRDEFYYIALSKHLAWGYVDVPPFMPFCIAGMRFLFGESIFSMHLLPAIFSAIVLVLTREIVKKFGGKLFAQTLALLCVMTAGGSIFLSSNIIYDCFDHLFWAVCLYLLVLLLTSGNKKYWLYLGLFAGLGLMSKFGMLWLMFGIVLAMPLTKERRYFCTWQFWMSGIIALVILSPYLIWIVQTHFLTFEYFAAYAQSAAPLTVCSFLIDQITNVTNPISFPVLALGLCYFLFDREGKRFRLFGFAYIFIAAVIIIQQAKYYTILPIFPVLFAGGAVYIERFAYRFRWIYVTTVVYTCLLVMIGIITIPAARPIFPVDVTIRYLNATHLFKSDSKMSTEKYSLGLLPQYFSDSFGWKEMTAQIAEIYYSLSEKERANTVIVTRNYGEASAIYFYEKKYKLPMPISQHLQYYVWGYQNMTDAGTAILIGWSNPEPTCKEIKQVGQTYNKYAVPYENKPIFLCRGLKRPVGQIWEEGKNMHM